MRFEIENMPGLNRTKLIISATSLLIILAHQPSFGDILIVPDSYSTIQEAIYSSNHGDTVLVQPGVYHENVQFSGKNIVLASNYLITGNRQYISNTIIDGSSNGSVVAFELGEDNTAILSGFTMRNGRALHGGGIYCWISNPVIKGNIIDGNSANKGGGIYCAYSNPLIVDCDIRNNSSFTDGGGIRCFESSPRIFNDVIYNNKAVLGGGVSCRRADPNITGVTFYRNRAETGGGIYIPGDSRSILKNSIFWGDMAEFGNEISNDSYLSVNITYCDIAGAWPGTGNLETDPLFRSPDSGDFHLMSIACGQIMNSPCIDAGDPNILDSLLDCSWGLGGIRSDMGAYGGGDSGTVNIVDNDYFLPNEITLLQNYPNPFNSGTTIRFVIVKSTEVRLAVYDILGRKVQTLIDEYKQAGIHTANFNTTGLSSGIYFCRLQVGEAVETRPMVLLR